MKQLLVVIFLFLFCFRSSHAICGDSVVDRVQGENCDDGNTNNGDGCNETCETETGFVCLQRLSKSFCYCELHPYINTITHSQLQHQVNCTQSSIKNDDHCQQTCDPRHSFCFHGQCMCHFGYSQQSGCSECSIGFFKSDLLPDTCEVCSSKICGPNGMCQPDLSCLCLPGWTGKLCTTAIASHASDDYQAHGCGLHGRHAQQSVHGARILHRDRASICICDQGYTGNRCQVCDHGYVPALVNSRQVCVLCRACSEETRPRCLSNAVGGGWDKDKDEDFSSMTAVFLAKPYVCPCNSKQGDTRYCRM